MPTTYRNQAAAGRYDFQDSISEERFAGSLPIDGWDWSIGVIHGNSGSGKSTIARELFPSSAFVDRNYHGPSILDDMPEKASMDDITAALTSAGFASPPNWFRPYGVLSQGEQMRVDIARGMLMDSPLLVFDEFTSTVDRTVAEVASLAIAKAIRRSSRRFVAVTCHDDILPWLAPDWTFCTDDMRFSKKGSGAAGPYPSASESAGGNGGAVIGGFII